MRGRMTVCWGKRGWASLGGRPHHPDRVAGGHHCPGSGCTSPHRSSVYPLCLSSLLSFLFWGVGKGLILHTLFCPALPDAALSPAAVRASRPVLGAKVVTTQVYQGV